MQDAAILSSLKQKYTAILADLDEQASRRWATAEARAIGWGGSLPTLWPPAFRIAPFALAAPN